MDQYYLYTYINIIPSFTAIQNPFHRSVAKWKVLQQVHNINSIIIYIHYSIHTYTSTIHQSINSFVSIKTSYPYTCRIPIRFSCSYILYTLSYYITYIHITTLYTLSPTHYLKFPLILQLSKQPPYTTHHQFAPQVVYRRLRVRR